MRLEWFEKKVLEKIENYPEIQMKEVKIRFNHVEFFICRWEDRLLVFDREGKAYIDFSHSFVSYDGSFNCQKTDVELVYVNDNLLDRVEEMDIKF